MSRSRVSVVTFLSVLFLWSALAQALPTEQSTEWREDDAYAKLTVWTEYIEGDVASFCELTIIVDETEGIELSEDDTVSVWIIELDTFSNDILFDMTFDVTAAEATANEFERFFGIDTETPCVLKEFDTDDGIGGESGAWEVFARLHVHKQECTILNGCWFQDEFDTDYLTVTIKEDDLDDLDGRNDDTLEAAPELTLGETYPVISRDEDWMAFEITETSDLDVWIEHLAYVGRLDGYLYTDEGVIIDTETLETDDLSWVYTEEALDPGWYYLKVDHRWAENYNHYDVTAWATPTSCADDASEELDCGNCGTKTRTCTAGSWGDWTECTGEGVCAVGATQDTACGMCGARTDTCSDECAWAEGTCEGEGVCEPEAESTEGCGADTSKICSDTCEWGVCAGDECTGVETEACYTGPEATDQVGNCARGTRTCGDGRWGSCEGQTLPRAEVCDDSQDNDCDGDTDGDDSQCDDGCADNDDCADPRFPECNAETGECEAAPDPVGCQRDADCSDPATPICNVSTGECEAAPEPEGCASNADCAEPTPICNPTTGDCEAAPTADPGVDAGTGTPDAGTGTPDAGTGTPDAGTGTSDTGGTGATPGGNVVEADSGCCAVAGASRKAPFSALVLSLVLGLTFVIRRRRS